MNPKNRKTNQVQGIDYDGMNQQEVADALGITRTAVQQIERRAYIKIKRPNYSLRLHSLTDLGREYLQQVHLIYHDTARTTERRT